ncbi:MAG: hypothetical protein ACJ8EY_09895 [Sphingomicrobium sp.]
MDLNYLYQRHQISLYRSDHAACERSRSAHRDFTRSYAALIAAELGHRFTATA